MVSPDLILSNQSLACAQTTPLILKDIEGGTEGEGGGREGD